ncbi:MAG: glucose-6-phosphate dehydrogenase assembly protein OpcA [Thermomicrobiales bacterium]
MSSSNLASPRSGIPISGISDALNQEWSELSSDVEQRTGDPPLRANTSTLVVVARAGSDAKDALETVHQLAPAVPSRVLLFILDPDCIIPEATIWAHCTVTPRGRHGACYDVIEITIAPDRIFAVPNIVAVHRLGELPTFVVWWGQAEISSPGFASIAGVADRFIVDSESYDRPLMTMHDYARFLGTAGTSVFGSDLAWARISTWRELIAQSFDPPSARRYAMNIRSVDITYDESQASGAMLLASWLTSRLGLEPANVNDNGSMMELRAATHDSDRRVTLNLNHSHRSGTGIRSVRILARAGSSVARISIFKRDTGTSTARIESPGMPRQERVVHHADAPRQELIAAELMRYTRDKIFEEALSHAAEFYRLLESNA